MNETQRRVLLAAAILVALIVLFPPYIVEGQNGRTLMAGYALLFNLPTYTMSSGGSVHAKLNAMTLLLQIVGVVVVTVLVFLATKR